VIEIETIDGNVDANIAQLALMADEFYVKLDNNGNIAGFGLYNGETSAFVVNVDTFAIIKADGSGDVQYPFVVDTESGLVAIAGNLLVDGSISATKIAADAIEATHIKAQAIEAAGIKIGAVGTDQMADDAITVDQLADNAITAVKINANAVTAPKILANAVIAGKIAANAVTATEINVSTLSAMAANVGTLTAGLLRSSDSRLQVDLTNKWIKVFDASSNLRVHLGYIP
jgi:hypothetical protein